MSDFILADLHDMKWISTGGACMTPMIRKVVELPKIEQAKLTVAGLGFFEVFINGKKVSDDLFLPLSTNYHVRPEHLHLGEPYEEVMRCRMYCPVYDISSYLKEGTNTICFMMGPGWYEMPNECYSFGNIKLCYAISYKGSDGEEYWIGSDEDHKWKESYVKKASLL